MFHNTPALDPDDAGSASTRALSTPCAVWVVARHTGLNAPSGSLVFLASLAPFAPRDGMGEDNAQRHRSVHGLGIRGFLVDARSPVDQHVNVLYAIRRKLWRPIIPG